MQDIDGARTMNGLRHPATAYPILPALRQILVRDAHGKIGKAIAVEIAPGQRPPESIVGLAPILDARNVLVVEPHMMNVQSAAAASYGALEALPSPPARGKTGRKGGGGFFFLYVKHWYEDVIW